MNRSVLLLCVGALAFMSACSKQESTSPAGSASSPPPAESTAPAPSSTDQSTAPGTTTTMPPADQTTPPSSTTPPPPPPSDNNPPKYARAYRTAGHLGTTLPAGRCSPPRVQDTDSVHGRAASPSGPGSPVRGFLSCAGIPGPFSCTIPPSPVYSFRIIHRV